MESCQMTIDIPTKNAMTATQTSRSTFLRRRRRIGNTISRKRARTQVSIGELENKCKFNREDGVD